MRILRLETSFAVAAFLILSNCGNEAAKVTTVIDAENACPGETAAERVACVDESRLTADIEAMSIERSPGSPGWQSVQDLCRDRLQDLGYQVTFESYGSGTNVIGRKEGSEIGGGEVIVSAHYDHIPGCPGADDNASGMAATLEVARLLATGEHRRPLVVACWDEEEVGLLGSSSYADGAFEAATPIAAMISFETIGFVSSEPNSQSIPPGFDILFPDQVAELAARDFRGDYISLIADSRSAAFAERFEDHADSVGLITSVLPVPESLKLVPATSDLRRSDHAGFWLHDYPGIMITDSANFRNPNYHCDGGMDLPGTLDMSFVAQVTQAALGAAHATLNAP